jgi:hypothetical protein
LQLAKSLNTVSFSLEQQKEKDIKGDRLLHRPFKNSAKKNGNRIQSSRL